MVTSPSKKDFFYAAHWYYSLTSDAGFMQLVLDQKMETMETIPPAFIARTNEYLTPAQEEWKKISALLEFSPKVIEALDITLPYAGKNITEWSALFGKYSNQVIMITSTASARFPESKPFFGIGAITGSFTGVLPWAQENSPKRPTIKGMTAAIAQIRNDYSHDVTLAPVLHSLSKLIPFDEKKITQENAPLIRAIVDEIMTDMEAFGT